MNEHIGRGAILLIIGFSIAVGVIVYMYTSPFDALVDHRDLLVAVTLFGGFLSLMGSISFFYGLAHYIVEELRYAGKQEKELGALPRLQKERELSLEEKLDSLEKRRIEGKISESTYRLLREKYYQEYGVPQEYEKEKLRKKKQRTSGVLC